MVKIKMSSTSTTTTSSSPPVATSDGFVGALQQHPHTNHPSHSPPPLLALPEGISDVVTGYEDSALLKVFIDYQEDQLNKLVALIGNINDNINNVDSSNTKSNHKIDLSLPQVDVVDRIVRSAECALTVVLDRMPNPSANQCLQVLKALECASDATVATSLQFRFKGIPQSAELVLQAILKRRQQSHLTIQQYNLVLKLWANSREHLRGTYCERFFHHSFSSYLEQQQTLRRQPQPQLQLLPPPPQSAVSVGTVEPNADSFRWLIRALCQRRSGVKDPSHLATSYILMWKAFDIEPPKLQDYHVVLKAWANSYSKTKALRAWAILTGMLEQNEDETKMVRPDLTCYTYCLEALSTALRPDSGEGADLILQYLADREILPNSECYTYAIAAWKNTALTETDPKLIVFAAARTKALLNDMRTAFHRSSSVVVSCTTSECNDVLRAFYAAADHHPVFDEAEGLLKAMEEATDSFLKPNVPTYRLVMDILARQSNVPEGMNKMDLANIIFQRMKEHVGDVGTNEQQQDLDGNDQDQDERQEETEWGDDDDDEDNDDMETSTGTVGVYNAFLRVCASIKIKDSTDQENVLRKAFELLNELENNSILEAHSATYLAFMDVVANVTGLGTKECTYAAERVFQKCCREGLLNKFILKTFQWLVPVEVYQSAVIDHCKRDESDRKWIVPQDWTRRSPLPLIRTEQGQQQILLSSDGEYIVPNEAYDYTTRNLRKRRGQKLLRGGRLFDKDDS